MSAYDRNYFTGVIPSGSNFLARYWGEWLGNYPTWKEANDAIIERMRR